jgi:hypothetical protein
MLGSSPWFEFDLEIAADEHTLLAIVTQDKLVGEQASFSSSELAESSHTSDELSKNAL